MEIRKRVIIVTELEKHNLPKIVLKERVLKFKIMSMNTEYFHIRKRLKLPFPFASNKIFDGK